MIFVVWLGAQLVLLGFLEGAPWPVARGRRARGHRTPAPPDHPP